MFGNEKEKAMKLSRDAAMFPLVDPPWRVSVVVLLSPPKVACGPLISAERHYEMTIAVAIVSRQLRNAVRWVDLLLMSRSRAWC